MNPAAPVLGQPLMCVEAAQLLAAAEEIGDAPNRVLRNGVVVHRLRPLGVVMAGDDVFDPYKD